MKKIIYPLAGAILGNQVTKWVLPKQPIIKTQSEKNDILSDNSFVKNASITVVSTVIPVALKLSGFSAMATSGIIASGITAYLNRSVSDKKPSSDVTDNTSQGKKGNSPAPASIFTATTTTKSDETKLDPPTGNSSNKENIVKNFKIVFTDEDKIVFTDEDKIQPAFEELKKQLENKLAQEKIEIIQDIFGYFKHNNNGNQNAAEIWTGLLTTLSEQQNINDDAKISLGIADGHKDTKIDFKFKQLKDFLNAFDMSYPNPNPTGTLDTAINNFIDNLKTNKPLVKIINNHHSGDSNRGGVSNYTSFVIQKKAADKYDISYINSLSGGIIKQQDFNKQDLRKKLKSILENNIVPDIFFSNIRECVIEDQTNLNNLKNKTNFTPYAQDTNACHQIAVMNLLKFFIGH